MFKKVFISGVTVFSLSVEAQGSMPQKFLEGETVQCEALENKGGTWGVKLKCGDGPHNIGYVHEGTFVRKIHMLLKDRETGKTRRHFFDVQAAMQAKHIPATWHETELLEAYRRGDHIHHGGLTEMVGINQIQRTDGLPIALYMPGEFGSSYYWKKFLSNFNGEQPNVLNEIKEKEEV